MSRIAETGFVYSVPDTLAGKVRFSKVYVNHGVMEKETSFGIDLSFPEMLLTKTVTTSDIDLLPGKIESTLQEWAAQYQRHKDEEHRVQVAASAEDMSKAARAALDDLKRILAHTLSVHDAVDWDAIKIQGDLRLRPEMLFKDGTKPDFIELGDAGQPTGFQKVRSLPQPTLQAVKAEYGLVARLAQENVIRADYEKRLEEWIAKEKLISEENAAREHRFNEARKNFGQLRKEYNDEKQRNNEALEGIRRRYKDAVSEAVEEYCDLVLNRSRYPDYFPKNWVLEYRRENRTMVLDYQLPASDRLPSIRSFTYNKQQDAIENIALSAAEKRALFESVAYQVCIRTIHELFEADVVNALDSLTLNGLVRLINPATGLAQTKTILSVTAPKAEFMRFDLSQIEPRATFNHLHGVAHTPLADLEPVTPLMTLQRTDKRSYS